ncbi:rhamnogalacturonan acetylesterase [Olivibacter sp. SDN3]|nr:rhamnogalacturonan acetylesterase [Olivibacter sp. SDN3]
MSLGLLIAIGTMSFIYVQDHKPTLYLIGDSTVKNGQDKGDRDEWGWGNLIAVHMDTSKIRIQNRALGGTSTRTYRSKGLWDEVLKDLKRDDVVIIQFGHNDGGPLDDTARARGTMKGIGNEQQEIHNPLTNRQETVRTYGWYLKKYIEEAKAKGAQVIICSPVPRNNFSAGKTIRQEDSYTQWAEQVAKQEKVPFINLQERVANEYDKLGEEEVAKFFPNDHTHTNRAGAQLNAKVFIQELRKMKKNALNKFIK